jgi:nitrite reductase/ring-hydroxylating ferredoxin subunit/uncharacterized membrane protein
MLDRLDSETLLKKAPQLEDQAYAVSRSIHEWVLQGGEQRRDAVDVLHGDWLGHPLHPVLTDITIGAWVLGFFFDLLGLPRRSKITEAVADRLITLGNLSATATALSGVADFSTIPQKSVATGAAHGLLNSVSLGLNVLSMFNRRRGKRGKARWQTALASTILLAAAWMGGEMVYKYRVGVNRITRPQGPKDWKVVMNEQDLPERTPMRVEVNGAPVLFYRYNGLVYAMGAVCGHEGAPLEKGQFDGLCVTCPWHQSVYDLHNGSVVHGPTTYASPSYETRTRDGRIEVRLGGPAQSG